MKIILFSKKKNKLERDLFDYSNGQIFDWKRPLHEKIGPMIHKNNNGSNAKKPKSQGKKTNKFKQSERKFPSSSQRTTNYVSLPPLYYINQGITMPQCRLILRQSIE